VTPPDRPADRPWERVYTVNDYYDGPRGGTADFGGVPHVYRNLCYDTEYGDPAWDPDDDRFELSPVAPEVLAMDVEAYTLWGRWQAAYFAGRAPDAPDEGPRVLPEDAERYAELERLLAGRLVVDPARRVVARGEFRRDPAWRPAREWGGPGTEGWEPPALQVRWTPLP
jgi:hypothetical protein